MSGKKRYEFNAETLAYEVHRIPFIKKFSKGFVLFLASLAVFVCYYLLYTQYFGLETPKTALLKQKYVVLNSRLGLLERRFEQENRALTELQMRDNNIYRPIFGMEEISPDVRNAGFGGVNRYAHLDAVSSSGALKEAVKRMDVIYRKAYVQSRSFDQVSIYAKRAGDMASCVPAIPPVTLDRIRFSSPFGYRRDPFTGAARMHGGIDLAGRRGEPVFVTGNGKVVQVRNSFFGYGREVVVDHGFGYKTRYAHLHQALVKVGDVVERGEQIALLGSTGKSNGNHLHYEVIYRDRRVNPRNYFNDELRGEEYEAMVKPPKNQDRIIIGK